LLILASSFAAVYVTYVLIVEAELLSRSLFLSKQWPIDDGEKANARKLHQIRDKIALLSADE